MNSSSSSPDRADGLTAEEMLELMSKVPPELFDQLGEDEMLILARLPDPQAWPEELRRKVGEYLILEEEEDSDPPNGLEAIDL